MNSKFKLDNFEVVEGCRLPVHMLKTNEWRKLLQIKF